jgi:hypothetical protein
VKRRPGSELAREARLLDAVGFAGGSIQSGFSVEQLAVAGGRGEASGGRGVEGAVVDLVERDFLERVGSVHGEARGKFNFSLNLESWANLKGANLAGRLFLFIIRLSVRPPTLPFSPPPACPLLVPLLTPLPSLASLASHKGRLFEGEDFEQGVS